MAINPKIMDELLADYEKPEDVIGENGLLKRLTKAVLERAMRRRVGRHLAMRSTTRRATTAAIRETAPPARR